MFERSSGFPYFLQFKSEFGNKEFSCLATSNLSWFMDLAFQVPMQYCSLQHWTLLLSPVTSTTGYCFCFGSILSFFLELFLHWSPVAYWAPTDLVNPLSVSYHFSFSYCSWSSQGKETEVVCHSLLQWTTFCQTSPPWPSHLGWPHTAWLMVRVRRVERSYSMIRRGGCEEIPLVQGKEHWLRFAGAAVKRYPTSKVRETQVRR